MTTTTLAAVLGAALLTACGEPPVQGAAERCAEVARIHRELQSPVSVTGQPVKSPDGSVTVEYEGMDAMNVPVRGSAHCRFAPSEQGDLTLLAAVVEGSPLDPGELDTVRGELGETR